MRFPWRILYKTVFDNRNNEKNNQNRMEIFFSVFDFRVRLLADTQGR